MEKGDLGRREILVLILDPGNVYAFYQIAV